MSRGATLIELVVALTILGFALSVAAVELPRPQPSDSSDVGADVAAARRRALESGLPVTITLIDTAGTRLVTAFPDGAVVSAATAQQNLLSKASNDDAPR